MYHFVFEPLYKSVFGQRKVLAKKPKPWRISTLLTACFGGWLLIKDTVMSHFGNECRNTEYIFLVHLLDEIVPLVYYFYPVIIRKGDYDKYVDAMARLSIMFIIHCRRHYDKATLAQLSDLIHHKTSIPLLHQLEREALNCLTEEKVEIFHSLLRRYCS